VTSRFGASLNTHWNLTSVKRPTDAARRTPRSAPLSLTAPTHRARADQLPHKQSKSAAQTHVISSPLVVFTALRSGSNVATESAIRVAPFGTTSFVGFDMSSSLASPEPTRVHPGWSTTSAKISEALGHSRLERANSEMGGRPRKRARAQLTAVGGGGVQDRNVTRLDRAAGAGELSGDGNACGAGADDDDAVVREGEGRARERSRGEGHRAGEAKRQHPGERA
jgi:hypothetical protein